MPRENIHHAIILKTAPFGEVDEIITLFSQEAGKVRALAKATKRPESRLRYALQPPMVSSITATDSSRLPKIIRAQPVKSFPNISEDAARAASWFVIAELTMRGTPDEQKNLPLFEAVISALDEINSIDVSKLTAVVIKWKLLFLDALGFGLVQGSEFSANRPKFFSNHAGGFEAAKTGTDAVSINESTWNTYRTIAEAPLENLASLDLPATSELDRLLTSFIEYQLERKIESEAFFKQSV